MKKIALAGLIAVGAALVAAAPSEADSRGHRHGHHHRHYGHAGHHARVHIGIGPSVWWGPYPYWYYPRPYAVYAPPPVVVAPPTVVVPEPPVYIQKEATVAAPGGPSVAADQFWYYCQSGKGYYPTVSTCAEPWVKVAPRPQ